MAQLLKIVALSFHRVHVDWGWEGNSTLFNFIKYVLGNMNVYEKISF